jgi:ankyrin repeat protein
LQVQQASRSSICECLHALCLYRPTPSAIKAVQDAIKSAHTHNTVVLPSPSVGTIGTTTTAGCISDCVVVNAALVTDAHGRTPLHIAVACGCSFSVIDLLLQDDYEAAYMMDHTNRYPLHWACTCSYMTSTPKSYSNKEREVDNAVKIINRLMEIYAMAVISKDDMGCTPLDIAKSVNADSRIISALQFVKNILPVKKRIKSHPDEATVITSGISKYPTREAICIYHDDHNFMDDVSSIGSRGVSKARRRRRTRSESPKGSSSRVRELVDI